MKIVTKTLKPRNPLALVARQRKAGSHAAENTARQQRRLEKQKLYQVVLGKKGGDDD
jgi:hypothetical protein